MPRWSSDGLEVARRHGRQLAAAHAVGTGADLKPATGTAQPLQGLRLERRLPPRRTGPVKTMLRTANVLATLLLLSTGCDSSPPPARCGTAPAQRIVGFVVTTITGDDGTDMDVELCYSHRRNVVDTCHELDGPGDDFEDGDTGVYELQVDPLEVGDLGRIRIAVRGGVLDTEWDLASLRIDVVLEGGARQLLYEQPEVETTLERGQSFVADDCGSPGWQG